MTRTWHFVLGKHQEQGNLKELLWHCFGDRGKLGISKKESHNKKN